MTLRQLICAYYKTFDQQLLLMSADHKALINMASKSGCIRTLKWGLYNSKCASARHLATLALNFRTVKF